MVTFVAARFRRYKFRLLRFYWPEVPRFLPDDQLASCERWSNCFRILRITYLGYRITIKVGKVYTTQLPATKYKTQDIPFVGKQIERLKLQAESTDKTQKCDHLQGDQNTNGHSGSTYGLCGEHSISGPRLARRKYERSEVQMILTSRLMR